MKKQGIPVSIELGLEKASDNGTKGNDEVALLHHLETLLYVFSNRLKLRSGDEDQANRNVATSCNIGIEPPSDSSDDKDDEHWLLLVYDDRDNQTYTSKACWSLNVYGGKRHLGETTLEAAIRETEEEISLKWDKSWVDERWVHKAGNAYYYLLSPPASTPSARRARGLRPRGSRRRRAVSRRWQGRVASTKRAGRA